MHKFQCVLVSQSLCVRNSCQVNRVEAANESLWPLTTEWHCRSSCSDIFNSSHSLFHSRSFLRLHAVAWSACVCCYAKSVTYVNCWKQIFTFVTFSRVTHTHIHTKCKLRNVLFRSIFPFATFSNCVFQEIPPIFCARMKAKSHWT